MLCMGRIFIIIDYNGYTMGVAGEKGCVFVSLMKDFENESVFYF